MSPSITLFYRILLFCLIAVAVIPVWSKDIRFRKLTVKDGLSQNSVHTFLEDRNGYIWVGTEDGLNRYNGYTFTHYKHDPSDSTSLLNNFVRYLAEGPTGVIWIGTIRGLASYNPGTNTFRDYQHISQLRDAFILKIAPDPQGRIWITTSQNGFGVLDPGNGSYQHFLIDVDNHFSNSKTYVPGLYVAPDGKIWVGGKNIFGEIDPLTGRFLRSRTILSTVTVRIRSFLEMPDGSLWIIANDLGLIHYYPEKDSMIVYQHAKNDPASIPSNATYAIARDARQRLWVGTTDAGLFIIDPENGKIMRTVSASMPGKQGLSGNFVESLFRDSMGNMWVGTNGEGFDFYDPGLIKFEHIGQNTGTGFGLSDNMVYALFGEQTSNGKQIWIGTDKGGLNLYRLSANQIDVFKHEPSAPYPSLSGNSIRAIYKHSDGNIWIGTNIHGISIYSPKSRTFSVLGKNDPVLSTLNVRTIIRDVYNPGVVWIGCTDFGLIRYDTDKQSYTKYGQRDQGEYNGLNKLSIRSCAMDSSGVLWVGTLGGGLTRFDPKNNSYIYFVPDPGDKNSINDNIVLTILPATFKGRKVLWLGTSAGINRMDIAAGTFTAITEKDGLVNNVVYAILPDDMGFLWVSTNRWLVRFDPANGKFKNYTTDDGLQSAEFNAGASYKMTDGTMLFGGINGFNFFHPDSIKTNHLPPPVYIERFKKFGKDVFPGSELSGLKKVELNYNEDFFAFEFCAINYSAPEKSRYAYQLTGFDKGWIQSGTRRYASYTNLDPGRYMFRVIASNNDGVWNKQGAVVEVVVHPPFWRTWWAYMIYLLLAWVLVRAGIWMAKNRKSIMALRKRRLSHYKLLELIGEGGVGSVFRAVDTNTDKIVVIKIIKKKLMDDAKTRERFRNEGDILAGLNHPNIVQVNETGAVNGQAYISMEYLPGNSLRNYIKAYYPLPFPEIRRILFQVCAGLSAIHKRGIIHRDIKSDNILFDAAGNVRIMDFGISRSAAMATTTTLGTVMGTLGYIAPEQITDIDVDNRIDLFALGVVLYEMLTGHLPFSGENEISLIHAIINSKPLAPTKMNPALPVFVDAIVFKCLAKSPNERYATVKELESAFLSGQTKGKIS